MSNKNHFLIACIRFIIFLVFGFYMIPALLYCLYNNLAFVNLKAYGPTSYWLLLQFRVVTTGVVYQVGKKLACYAGECA